MAKTRPHCSIRKGMEFPPYSETIEVNEGKAPVVPSGEVSRQKSGGGRSRVHGPDPYERGLGWSRASHERNPPGGRQKGAAMNSRNSAMPKVGHQSATAPGALARPGSERNSSTMDARSSVPTSIQQGPNTRDRFGSLSYGEKNTRADNAELDDNVGTGRRSRGSWRGARRM